MADLASALQREVPLGLLSHRPVAGGIKQWFMSENYSISQNARGALVLTGIDAASLFPYLLWDYARFSLSSLESIACSFHKPFDERALAWVLLNRYYAAFFAAHAILRSLGVGIVWIDVKESGQLQKVGRLYLGNTFSLSSGGYAFKFEANNGYDAELSLTKVGIKGGSHEELWRYFARFLMDFSSSALTRNVPNAASVTARMEALRRVLLGPDGNNASWLSLMRNELNYQHKFGAWFPFQSAIRTPLSGKNLLKLGNLAADLGVNHQKSPLHAFNSGCCFISLVSMDLAKTLKERAGSGASHFRADWNHLQAALKV